jgi:hypothetical protein
MMIRSSRWVGCVLLLLVSVQWADAKRGVEERDKLSDDKIKTEGFLPVLFSPFTISADNPRWDERVSYVMTQDRAVLVQIEPVKKPAGVIMFVSQPGSPRVIKAVWSNDRVTEPIRFWTDRYWLSDKGCDSTGCPHLMFKATSGTLGVTILDRRP